MKKLILSFMALASMLTACANTPDDGTFHVKGQLTGISDTLVFFTMKADANSGYRRDTVATPGGKFDVTLPAVQPNIFFAYTPGTLRRQQNIGFHCFGMPGETLELSGDVNDMAITGSKFYKEYGEIDRLVEDAEKPFTDFTAGLSARIQAGENQDSVTKEYDEKSPAMREQVGKAIMEVIKTHPTYEAVAAFIPTVGNFGGIDKMKEAVQLMAPEVRDGRMRDYYQQVINDMEARQRAEDEAKKKQATGTVAPDFTLNDLQDKPLSLSSLRGKYVILDFWGSWCIWCIKGFPKMKEYYNKYKGKFEILGIDCNDSEEKWKAAVKKHELPWLHVYNPEDSNVLNLYGIQGFPTKVLVGPDGKIVKTIVGEDPAFYTFLDEQFGK